MRDVAIAFGCGLLGSLTAFGVFLVVFGSLLRDGGAITWGGFMALAPCLFVGIVMRRARLRRGPNV